ncbi:MAG: TonB-dependent receptor plug domain-containing protein [Candidatus Marinimicrobia bacterium]|nr:TonB-dependent receptor plug domain-containing protein [Candidatus Neomarinimicrobiota bacterium]
MVGYTRMVVEGVRVRIDLTTQVDIAMREEVIGLDEVVVTARKEVVKVDIASSQTDISSEQIRALPVQSMSQVIGMEAGIDENYNIRGSAAYEAAFTVDGMSMNDERFNNPYTTISLNAVKEVNIQIGGFNAEYENARSGVINVITKEGDREDYDIGVILRYAPPNKKYFGPVITAEDAYFARPYNDDDACALGCGHRKLFRPERERPVGPRRALHRTNRDGRYTGFHIGTFTSGTAISPGKIQCIMLRRNSRTSDPDNDRTAAAWQRVYRYQHRRSANIVSPDYTLDVGVGGPVPGISKALGDLRFYASYRGEQEALAVPLCAIPITMTKCR